MSDWADEMAERLSAELFDVDWGTNDINGTERFTVDTPKLAEALRSVERRTAEECENYILTCKGGDASLAVYAIRERFHLEGK